MDHFSIKINFHKVWFDAEIHDNKLVNILNDPKAVQNKLGFEMTKILKTRLNQLEASSNFKEYLDIGLGKPHSLTGNLSGYYGIQLNRNYRLIVEPLTESLDIE